MEIGPGLVGIRVLGVGIFKLITTDGCSGDISRWSDRGWLNVTLAVLAVGYDDKRQIIGQRFAILADSQSAGGIAGYDLAAVTVVWGDVVGVIIEPIIDGFHAQVLPRQYSERIATCRSISVFHTIEVCHGGSTPVHAHIGTGQVAIGNGESNQGFLDFFHGVLGFDPLLFFANSREGGNAATDNGGEDYHGHSHFDQ